MPKPKLTDTQLVILSTAAKRKDLAVLPLPKTLKCNKGAVTTVLKSLLSRGLVSEKSASVSESAWREEGDQGFRLELTQAGLQAIGIEPAETKKPQRKPVSKHTAKDKDPKPESRTGTKLSMLVDLLKRKTGATISDIAAATGWQHHSIRGAISGMLKKKMGLTIVSTPDVKRGRVYRIA